MDGHARFEHHYLWLDVVGVQHQQVHNLFHGVSIQSQKGYIRSCFNSQCLCCEPNALNVLELDKALKVLIVWELIDILSSFVQHILNN